MKEKRTWSADSGEPLAELYSGLGAQSGELEILSSHYKLFDERGYCFGESVPEGGSDAVETVRGANASRGERRGLTVRGVY